MKFFREGLFYYQCLVSTWYSVNVVWMEERKEGREGGKEERKKDEFTMGFPHSHRSPQGSSRDQSDYQIFSYMAKNFLNVIQS